MKQRKEYLKKKDQAKKQKNESNDWCEGSVKENYSHKKHDNNQNNALGVNSNKMEKKSRITVTASHKKESRQAPQRDHDPKNMNSHSKQFANKDTGVRHFYESDDNKDPEKNDLQTKLDRFDSEEYQAAIKIQSIYRGRKVRKEMGDLKKQSQTTLPKGYSSKAVGNYNNFEEEKQRAAMKIQADYRERVVGQKIDQVKQSISHSNQSGGMHIGLNERDRVQSIDASFEKKEDKKAFKEKENMAAVKIQSRYKGIKQRQKFKEMKQNKGDAKKSSEGELEYGEEKHRAATKIQSRYKGLKQRKEYQQIKQEKGIKSSKKTIHEIEIGLAPQDDENKAAIKIQSVYKGKKQRQKFQNLKQSKVPDVRSDQLSVKPNLDEEENTAAAKIQIFYKETKQTEANKGEKSKINATAKEYLANPDFEYDDEAHRAATIIQSVYKGTKDRRLYQSRKQAEIDRIEKELRELDSQLFEQEKSALKIESTMCGNMIHKNYMQLKQEKKNDTMTSEQNKSEPKIKEEKK